MNADIQAKIDVRNRTRLETVLPLRTPYTILFEPSTFCNLKCEFCVHYDQIGMKEANFTKGHMNMNLYKKMVDDLKQFPEKVKSVKFCGLGENLMTKEFPEMIRYLKQANVAERIDCFTNGILLNPDVNKAIIEAGLDWINISVNGVNEEEYKKTCGYAIDYTEFVKNIKNLYDNKKQCMIYIKLSDNGMSTKDKEKFYDLFGDICDKIYIETIVDSDQSWPGANINVKKKNIGIYGEEIKEKQVCPFLFTQISFDYKGRAFICGADWKRNYIIGDANKKSIREIWESKELLTLQLLHLRKEKYKIPICSNCKKINVCSPDNIDLYTDELIIKFEAKQ